MKLSKSGIFLIIVLVIAIALGAWVTVMTCNVLAKEPITTPNRTGSDTPQTVQPVEKPKEPNTFVISMVGDCTLASIQTGRDFDSYIDKNGTSWPFSGVLEYLSKDEFTLANLECAFSDEALKSSSLFYFRGPSSYADILMQGSVECVTLGNNHTDDFGAKGVADTKAAVDAAEGSWTAAGESKVFTTEHGLKIGVYCPGWTGLSKNNVITGIQKLKDDGADILIFAPHWGVEGSYRVNANQEALAHAAIDAGAHIVCGTHPHVLQKMESYNGGYIFYSLGNFSFGGNTAPRDVDTAIAQVTVKKDGDGWVIDGYDLIPCRLSSTDSKNDYRPRPYDKDEDGYARTIGKLDGSWTGSDLNVDYSFMYQ